MNKKKPLIFMIIGMIVLLSIGYYVVVIDNKKSEEITESTFAIPEENLPEIDESDVGDASIAEEMTGEEWMQKELSIRDLLIEMDSSKEDRWDEVEKLLEEYYELETRVSYLKDIHTQLIVIYQFSEFCTSSDPHVDYESEIEKQKNKVELLREDYIKRKIELKHLISKRDIAIRSQIEKLLYLNLCSPYTDARVILMTKVTCDKLKKGAPLEILPPWEEGEHYLKKFFRYHVWVGMYNTDKPGIDNYIGSFTTDDFTSDMGKYWEVAQNKNKQTKSIRIKWIYVSEEHKIVWEGNKNESEEWYTFAKYEERYVSPEYDGEPPEGFYTVVNMSTLDYPEFKQYYVMSYRPKGFLNMIL